MWPQTCTQNSLFHIDYGVPIIANKSTDYRTSTAKNLRFRPEIPQQFDCRVKAKIKPELLEKDMSVRDYNRSISCKDYQEKHVGDMKYLRAVPLDTVKGVRSVEEKIFQNPPCPRAHALSEMKEKYTYPPLLFLRDNVVSYNCEIPDHYRPIQPDIYTSEKGFQKYLDIYLTENMEKYPAYSQEELRKAQEDLVTLYNASGRYNKGLKEALPGKLHGRTNMFDKSIFKAELPNRFLSRAPKRVPFSGMTSEYRSNYPHPTCTDFYPYIQANNVYFPESLSKASAWQDLCPPSMYCTEGCHVGTGWPVRAVVDVNKVKQSDIVHAQGCCTKIDQ